VRDGAGGGAGGSAIVDVVLKIENKRDLQYLSTSAGEI